MKGPTIRRNLGLAVSVAVAVVLTAGLYQRLSNANLFSTGRSYSALTANATGVNVGDPVKIAGVQVGSVTRLGLEHGLARIGFRVQPGVVLRVGTTDQIRWRGILGQESLYLYVPNSGRPLPPGSTLPDSASIASAGVNSLLSSLGPILSSISVRQANTVIASLLSGLGGNEAQAGELITNASAVAQNVGQMSEQVADLITNLDTVMSALASRDSQTAALLDNLSHFTSVLASNDSNLDQLLVDMPELLSEISSVLDTNRSRLGNSITQLSAITNVLAQHQQDLATGLSTLSAGLISYAEISSLGQWFETEGVYVCLDYEATCQDENPLGPPGSQPSSTGSGSSNAPAAEVVQVIAPERPEGIAAPSWPRPPSPVR
jgi:phospholipid/cholesterol/gamma-HCH transport system substrate-binding protein